MLVDLLTPLVKAWCTDLGVENTSLAVQVHGGMGFIEETGVAQHFRDARIAPIYEGTNGIQAMDLLGRKLMRDQGAAAHAFVATMRELDVPLAEQPGDDLAVLRRSLAAGLDAVEQATKLLVESFAADPARAAAGSVPYLNLFATVAGGWLLGRQALAAQAQLSRSAGDAGFNEAKLMTARFFAEQYLSPAASQLSAIGGGATIVAFDPDQF